MLKVIVLTAAAFFTVSAQANVGAAGSVDEWAKGVHDLDVITLPAESLPELDMQLGWRCDSFFQAGFQLYPEGRCQPRGAEGVEIQLN